MFGLRKAGHFIAHLHRFRGLWLLVFTPPPLLLFKEGVGGWCVPAGHLFRGSRCLLCGCSFMRTGNGQLLSDGFGHCGGVWNEFMNGSIKLRSETIGGVIGVEIEQHIFARVPVFGAKPYIQCVSAVSHHLLGTICMTESLQERGDRARIRHFDRLTLRRMQLCSIKAKFLDAGESNVFGFHPQVVIVNHLVDRSYTGILSFRSPVKTAKSCQTQSDNETAQ